MLLSANLRLANRSLSYARARPTTYRRKSELSKFSVRLNARRLRAFTRAFRRREVRGKPRTGRYKSARYN